MKRCGTCAKLLPLDKFYRRADKSRGHRSTCKVCCAKNDRAWRDKNPERITDLIKFRHIKRKYGLTQEQYKALIESTGRKCPLCEKPYEGLNGGRSPAVDHCHKTGKFRHVICKRCNLGLGHFDDNPELLKAAALYLEASKLA